VLQPGLGRRLGLLARGDVLTGAERPGDTPPLVLQDRVVPGDDPLRAVAGQQRQFQVLMGSAPPERILPNTARARSRACCGMNRSNQLLP